MKIENNVIFALLVLMGYALVAVFVPGWEAKVVAIAIAIGVMVYVGVYLKHRQIDWIKNRMMERLKRNGYEYKLEEDGAILINHRYGYIKMDLCDTRFRLNHIIVMICFRSEEMAHLPKHLQDSVQCIANIDDVMVKVWYENDAFSVMYHTNFETVDDAWDAFKLGVDQMHVAIDPMMQRVYIYTNEVAEGKHRIGFRVNYVENEDVESDK